MTIKFVLAICCLFSLLGCADRAGTENTLIAGGIIQGDPLTSESMIANQTVLIVQNYEYRDQKPNLFGLCTGTIIDERTILTAAHCLSAGTEKMVIIHSVNPRKELTNKDLYLPVDFTIHQNYLNKDDLDKKINSIKKSNDKAQGLIENPDLALIYLDRPIENQFDKDFFLQDEFKIPNTSNISIQVSGYGKTTALQDTSNIKFEDLNGTLMSAKLIIQKESLAAPGFYLDQRNKPGICNGDSGAPVTAIEANGKLKLVAMAVNVFEINNHEERKLNKDNKFNACGSHGLYLNLESHRDWIISTNLSLKRNAH